MSIYTNILIIDATIDSDYGEGGWCISIRPGLRKIHLRFRDGQNYVICGPAADGYRLEPSFPPPNTEDSIFVFSCLLS